MTLRQQEPIAIVGIGCLFPKAPSLQDYWANILSARDCISDVPDDHSWSVDDFYDSDHSKKDRTWCTRGGFLDKLPFDPIAYGIPPNQLESIDTSQLLSLICAREALKDAGIDPDGDNWDRDGVGVILGCTGTQEMAVNLGARLHGPRWRKALRRCGVDEDLVETIVEDIGRQFPTWTEQSFPGLLGNVVAGRITNRLNLGSTNCVVDAACASSLAAIQYAIGDLASGRSDMVLTGGVDTLNDSFMFQCFTRTPAFSQSNNAKPFDRDADGILIGEGIAIMAMKRLSDAEANGDRIYAVLRGLGSSSDGKGKSIYAPNSAGQAKALRKTYAMAGISPETVELVEAHGTGTKAGDLAEMNGLLDVYSDCERTDRWVALGSVKSQIGHTKSTAGAAGMVKAALALYHQVLPPTIKVDNLNPKMALENSPFYINTIARPWIRNADHPRRAGVSAFGFGGSNFHAILEESAQMRRVEDAAVQPGQLFVFASDNPTELIGQLSAIRGGLSSASSLAHAAHQTIEDYQPRSMRLSFVATDIADAEATLAKAEGLVSKGEDYSDDKLFFRRQVDQNSQLAVLFPGQGSQYPNMGRALAIQHPEARSTLDRAEQHLHAAGRASLAGKIFPIPAFSADERTAQIEALRATEWAQPAIGAVSVAMLNVLRAYSIQPDAYAGHSYGELVALHAAGVINEQDLWELSRVRGEAMADRGEDRGTMAAVSGALQSIAELIERENLEVVLANRNHPTQGVISGSEEAVNAALSVLEKAGFSGQKINVSAAFHSPLVADAAQPLIAALKPMDLQEPHTPIYANATGAVYPNSPKEISELLAKQITTPVHFVEITRALYDKGIRVFIECGPKRVLQGLIKKTLGHDVQVIAINPDQDRVDADLQFSRALAQLVVSGATLDLEPLLKRPLPQITDAHLSPATVQLGGANYLNESTKNPPLPTLPERREKVASAEVVKPVPVEEPRMKQPENTPTAQQTTPAVDASSLQQLLQATQQTLSAFQLSQERAAKVHTEYLQTHAKATETFAQLFDTHAQLVGMATGRVQPNTQTHRVTPPPVTPIAAPATTPTAIESLIPGYTESTLLPHENTPRSASTSRSSALELNIATELPPLLDANSVLGGTSANNKPAAPAAPRTATIDIEGALLASVAEKTGYPKEMLELSMHMESDLGIDSIKRVEIMAAVQDRLPSLPEIDNERLSAMQTLAEVYDCLKQTSESQPVSEMSSLPTAPTTMVDLTAATLSAVSEKTGYPKDMLELSMHMESDLGIDSIKRVEIMAAVQDAVPGLPEVDNERLSSLQTLDEVVGYLSALAGTTSTVVNAGPTVDLSEAVFQAVAEKTGYPKDMLEPSMDMESDLGIDSIKRVEIMAAVQDSVPGMPEIDNDRLSSTRTLADVIQLISGYAPAQVASSTSNSSVKSTDLEEALKGTVAVKTGYPKEMLSLEMDMESDLGIDSIKRVEIMAALQDEVPGLPELDNDRLSSLKTLQEVLNYVLELAGETAAPATVPASTTIVPPKNDEVDVHQPAELPPTRRALRQVEANLGKIVAPTGPVLITRDLSGLADKLGATLDARGFDVVLLEADWTSSSSIKASMPPNVHTMIHAAAIGATGDELRHRVRAGFLLANAAGPVARFVTLSEQGGDFGIESGEPNALQGSLAGLAKTIALEWEDCTALAIDFGPGINDDQLADAVMSIPEQVEIGLRDGKVWTIEHPVIEMDVKRQAPPIEPGQLVVISGGARGVTAAVAIEMAKRWQPSLLLLGRSELTDEPEWAQGIDNDGLTSAYAAASMKRGKKPSLKALKAEVEQLIRSREVQTNLDKIREAGSSVIYSAVDVRDPRSVSDALETARSAHGPVRGLVHGAGVLADKFIVDKTEEQFDTVFGTKVEGLENLLAATNTEELNMLALFTSVAGRYGNRGQCDYAMANEALTRKGLLLARQNVRVKAFDWGPWDGGMVNDGLRKQFEKAGIQLIGLRSGASFFCDEFESTSTDVEVVVGGPDAPGSLIQEKAAGEVIKNLEETQPYLRDHQIAGSPVLPAAMALEWMAQAAQEAFPKMHFAGIREFNVVNGVILRTNRESLTLRWTQLSGSSVKQGLRSFAVELISINEKLQTPKVHYKGIVDLAEAQPKQPSFPGSNGLGKKRYPYQVDEAYRRFLFHGPSLRGIENIVGYSDEGMVARLNSSDPKQLGQPNGTWLTDPVAIDCALQMMLLWVRDKYGNTALPASVGEYQQFQAFDGPVTCHLVMDATEAKRGSFHATFVNDDGLVVAQFDAGQYVATPKRIAFGEA